MREPVRCERRASGDAVRRNPGGWSLTIETGRRPRLLIGGRERSGANGQSDKYYATSPSLPLNKLADVLECRGVVYRRQYSRPSILIFVQQL